MKVSLKALRVNANLNQAIAAERLGITRRTLQNWECGITSPTVYQLNDLCKIYGCTLSDIFLPDKLAKS